MLWSGDPNKPICKLAGGIDPMEIKGLIGEHLKKLLRFFFTECKSKRGQKKIKLIKIVLNEVRHNGSILKQQLPRRLLKLILTSCFSLSFFSCLFYTVLSEKLSKLLLTTLFSILEPQFFSRAWGGSISEFTERLVPKGQLL